MVQPEPSKPAQSGPVHTYRRRFIPSPVIAPQVCGPPRSAKREREREGREFAWGNYLKNWFILGNILLIFIKKICIKRKREIKVRVCMIIVLLEFSLKFWALDSSSRDWERTIILSN
ncbi:hypothetical protein KFK09_015215 [Dendrobium nobile]|uniref:Uncharacterized protein n=1 Tax=Dendrobium nobile TaxID=94219 RepID=A0A8T3B6L6_DENNO|nr:hypothetical protein KFK09_015215 [Dendrobium nobile]